MLLPHRRQAYVPEEKLIGYLLNPAHPVGGSKAQFFLRFGFSAKNADALAEGLLRVARSEAVQEEKPTPYGTKYVIGGSLKTPRGPAVRLETVWIVETGQDKPRLVTAYPA